MQRIKQEGKIMEKKQPVKMSIIIPVHGRTDLFEKTLKSTLAQKCEDYEIVVTDDSSLESERKQIRDIIKKHDHRNIVRYIFTMANLLQAPNTNQGIGIAHGKYVRLLHSDDLISENCIQREIQLLNEYPDKNFLYHNPVHFTGIPNFKEHNEAIELKPTEWLECNIFLGTALPSTMVFRREFLERIGMLDEKYKFVCDWKLFLNVLFHEYKAGGKLLYVPAGYVGWRIHDNQITSTMAMTFFDEYGDLLSYIKNIYETSLDILTKRQLKENLRKACDYRYRRLLEDYSQYKNFKLPPIPLKHILRNAHYYNRSLGKAYDNVKRFAYPFRFVLKHILKPVIKWALSPFAVMIYLLKFVISRKRDKTGVEK
jgi:glycosyltransferase involved in cell wall biosynthesis